MANWDKIDWDEVKEEPKLKRPPIGTKIIINSSVQMNNGLWCHDYTLKNIGSVTPWRKGKNMKIIEKLFEEIGCEFDDDVKPGDYNIVNCNTTETPMESRENLVRFIRKLREKNLTTFTTSPRRYNK